MYLKKLILFPVLGVSCDPVAWKLWWGSTAWRGHVVESGCPQGERGKHPVLPQDHGPSHKAPPGMGTRLCRISLSYSPGADKSSLKGKGSFCSR